MALLCWRGLISSEHAREAALSCLTTSLAANSDSSRPYRNDTFQCRSNNEQANSRGPGLAQLGVGVSRRGRCRYLLRGLRFLCCCVVRRSTDRRWSSVFWPRATYPLAPRSPARSVRWAVSHSRPSAFGRRISTSAFGHSRLAPGGCRVAPRGGNAFFFNSACCSCFSTPARIRGPFSGVDPRTWNFH